MIAVYVFVGMICSQGSRLSRAVAMAAGVVAGSSGNEF
jgi:hypothetical protein